MKKKLYKGSGVKLSYEKHEVEIIPDIRNIDNQPENEWFIVGHGNELFYQPRLLNKVKSFLNISYTKKSDLIFTVSEEEKLYEWGINILNNIQIATPKQAVNTIHIFACHSGAAHNSLKNVSGNFILCTYSKHDKMSIEKFSERLYENRFNSPNLIDFISKNFHLLAAVNFKISYKFSNKIYNFSLDNNKIKDLTTSEALKLFLNNEYSKFTKFHSDLFNKYNKKFPEIFVNELALEDKEFTEGELNEAISCVLVLEVSNYNYNNLSSLIDIKNLLKFENLDTSLSIDTAIQDNNIEVLNLLLKDNITIAHDQVRFAYLGNNPQIAEIILKHYTGKLTTVDIFSVINKANSNKDYCNLLEKMLQYPGTELTQFIINYALSLNNPHIDEITLKHSSNLSFDQEIINLNNNLESTAIDFTVNIGEVAEQFIE